MAEWYDPPVDLIRLLGNALRRIGNDEDIRQLRSMAEACRQLQTAVSHAHEELVKVVTLTETWEGDDAATFKETWGRWLHPGYREEAIVQLGAAAVVLDSAADVSAKTQEALKRLIESLVIAVMVAVATSAATAGLGSMAAWARSAKTTTEVAVVSAQVLGRFRLILHSLGAVVRRGTIAVGRSGVVRGLGMKASGETSFLSMAQQSWSGYWRIYRWGLGGNFAINAVANPFVGRSPFERSLLSIAEGSNAAVVAGVIGGTGNISVLAAMRPWIRNFTQGMIASSGATLWNDRVEKKSWSVTSREMAVTGLMAGGLNVVYVGVGESKAASGLVRDAWRAYWKELPPLAKGYVVGFPGNTSVRVAVPWAAKPGPLDMPEFKPLPGGTTSP
ncbi:hypothetical protein GCM10022226_56280 [Sphaerisporangium flaviroseum]|uniref:WXG100 family type VII secretion target n=1 Tax=Sphaerisporangium flaviroseum TaxID=509199 RepID=A0ABP7IVW2_9ACTN